MSINHTAESLDKVFGLENHFLVYYTAFIIVEVLKQVTSLGSFSKEVEVLVDSDITFWNKYPKLLASMNERERLILFQIGAKKAIIFLEENIFDQASYDRACIKMVELLDIAYIEYKNK